VPDEAHVDPDQALEALAALWRRERKTDHERFVERRQRLTFQERVAAGIALANLRVVDVIPAPGGMLRVLCDAPGLDRLRLGGGDPVSLWRPGAEAQQPVRAVLARRFGEQIGVMVSDELPGPFEDFGFNLDQDEMQVTFDRGDKAIRTFLDAGKGTPLGKLRGVLFGGAPCEFGREEPLTANDSNLNEPQRAAVARALAAERVALIHGPPGTGKTRTLVEVIRQSIDRDQRVLATAASNSAVDNLAERLVDAGVDVVRIGHPARVSAAVEGQLLSVLVDQSARAVLARGWITEARKRKERLERRWDKLAWEEKRAEKSAIRDLRRDARDQLRLAKNAILEGASVICATAAGADTELLGNLDFDLVVLDEATQAVDPMALVALARAPRAVLAGDPCQLPPTVLDRVAEREGLGTTFFERLAGREGEDAVRLLTVQYRMHASIMAFPSESKYEGRLVADPSVAEHVIEDLDFVEPDPLRPAPLTFVDAAGKGWEEGHADDDPSTRNEGQGERTACEVRRLISRGVSATDIGVITPYYAQVRLLREHLTQEVADGLEIHSVDGFQGREKEAIVLDLVRSNDRNELGFLGDTRRMNVALTRARRFLLVVGDSATLGNNTYYTRFMAGVDACGDYLSAWADEAEPFE
jgi:ATP-dependent RNA/DNA helicase IGHMBP2